MGPLEGRNIVKCGLCMNVEFKVALLLPKSQHTMYLGSVDSISERFHLYVFKTFFEENDLDFVTPFSQLVRALYPTISP